MEGGSTRGGIWQKSGVFPVEAGPEGKKERGRPGASGISQQEAGGQGRGGGVRERRGGEKTASKSVSTEEHQRVGGGASVAHVHLQSGLRTSLGVCVERSGGGAHQVFAFVRSVNIKMFAGSFPTITNTC